MKTAKKAIFFLESEASNQETESSQEETENLTPWLRILDETEKRHETQINALINEYEGTEIQKMWPAWKPRTLFFLFTEKS